jgi:hypothetical protein
MTDITQQSLQTAESISNYGLMTVIAAFFVVLSAIMMVAVFLWFKSIINRIIKQQDEMMNLSTAIENNGHQMQKIAEALSPETKLRVKTISGVVFDLGEERSLKLIKRVREENNIKDKEKTSAKIMMLVRNDFEDSCSKLDNFTYSGKRLSRYANEEWIGWVGQAVESEIYHEAGENALRASTNIGAVFDKIKLDFYHRLDG